MTLLFATTSLQPVCLTLSWGPRPEANRLSGPALLTWHSLPLRLPARPTQPRQWLSWRPPHPAWHREAHLEVQPDDTTEPGATRLHVHHRQELWLLQLTRGADPLLTLAGHLGPSLPLPLGRLPVILPLPLPSPRGLLGLNRRVRVSAPGSLQLSLGPATNDFTRWALAAGLDEQRPWLVVESPPN